MRQLMRDSQEGSWCKGGQEGHEEVDPGEVERHHVRLAQAEDLQRKVHT